MVFSKDFSLFKRHKWSDLFPNYDKDILIFQKKKTENTNIILREMHKRFPFKMYSKIRVMKEESVSVLVTQHFNQIELQTRIQQPNKFNFQERNEIFFELKICTLHTSKINVFIHLA